MEGTRTWSTRPPGDPRSMRPLLIATPGGHLTQLLSLAPRLGIDADAAMWVSIPTAQSRSVLADRDVVWARYGRPRDLRALAQHLLLARRTLRREQFSVAISTGASLAPPFLAAAGTARVPAHYIESATRVAGPSFAGRLVSRLPGVTVYSQYPSWASGRWKYGGNILDGWDSVEQHVQPCIRTVFVTVGSARGFPFSRMLDAVKRVIPEGCTVTWQIGDADGTALPGRHLQEMTPGQVRTAIETSDVVISHAGTGSVVSCLEAGRCPVIIPRSAEHGEHVDDHQRELASMLADRGLAIVRSPDDLGTADLNAAAMLRVVRSEAVPFRLAI